MNNLKKMLLIILVILLTGCKSFQVEVIVNIKQISSGLGFSVLLNSDGNVYTSGLNDFAQLGINNTIETREAHHVIFKSKIKIIESGSWSSYAVDSKNRLYTWGCDVSQNVIKKDTIPLMNMKPTLIKFSKNIIDLAAGSRHLLILTEDSEVYSYGLNSKGSLGIGASENEVYYIPQKIDLDEKAIQIAAGGNISAILTETGSVYVFGSNEYKQFGIDSIQMSTLPLKLQIPYKVTKIIVGFSNIFLISENNILYGAGANQNGQVGIGIKNQIVKEFAKVVINDEIILADMINTNTGIAYTKNGEIYYWGSIVNEDLKEEFIPTPIIFPSNEKIKSFTGSQFFINDSNELFGWGNDKNGRLFIKIINKYYFSPVIIDKFYIKTEG